MYYSTISSVMEKRWQKSYSDKIMLSIENELKAEKVKKKRMVNAYWLNRLMETFEEEFKENEELVSKIQKNVFSKWKKYRCNRDFYLAPTDIYREIRAESSEIKARVEHLIVYLREEREKEENVEEY